MIREEADYDPDEIEETKERALSVPNHPLDGFDSDDDDIIDVLSVF